jgi:hypothetical protein
MRPTINSLTAASRNPRLCSRNLRPSCLVPSLKSRICLGNENAPAQPAGRIRVKATFQIILGLLLCQLSQGGEVNPPMTRIVSRFLVPEIQPGSFASKPRTLYIAGTSYSRTEEEPDPEQGIHGLLIANEPNVWMINLFDHAGRHIVDPGPTYIVHHRILEQEAPKEFDPLEFGKEVAFFRAHQTASPPEREIDGVRCDASAFNKAPYRIVLYTRSDTHVPWQLEVYKDGKFSFGIRYLSYETNLPFQSDLFHPPSGIRLKEAKPEEGTTRPPVAKVASTPPAADVRKFGGEMTYFYLAPLPENFHHLQAEADGSADSLSKSGNVDLLAAVVIATAAEKHHWEITGSGQISRLAKELRVGKSRTAKYVGNDSIVDVGKLDVWWADFFATGDEKYLAKILRRAKHPQPGERAADFMMPAMAAWSFKSNCQQHKAVLAFARGCLQSNAYPEKKEFLKECVEAATAHPPRR